MQVHHLNCGTLQVPPRPAAACHCLLVAADDNLVLVDTGIGMADVQDPVGRLGHQLIEAAGFQFDERATALRQIEGLGYSSSAVTDIVLTHADADHTGGLADFPHATVHVSAEEHVRLTTSGHWRYVRSHFSHRPRWQLHAASSERWFGLEARPVSNQVNAEVLLVPLFGHTLGHCGVAIRTRRRWILHVGDAYYLRGELANENHPVSVVAAQRADDDDQRRASLQELRRLASSHVDDLEFFGYHDVSELPRDNSRFRRSER